MALSLPLFIANVLGLAGAGYLSGKGQREAADKYAADQWQRQVMKEALFKGVFEQGSLPPRPALISMLGGGSQAEQMADMLGQIVESQQNARVAKQNQLTQLMRQYGGGGDQPGMVPNYFGVPTSRAGVEPLAPDQQAAFGHLMGPAQTEPGAPPAPPPAPTALAQVTEPTTSAIDLRPTPPTITAPEPVTPTAPVRPVTPRLVPGRVAQPHITITDVGGKQTINIALPTNEDRTKATTANIHSQAVLAQVSPRDLVNAAAQQHVVLDDKQFAAYGERHWAMHHQEYIRDAQGALGVVKGALPDANVMALAVSRYAAEHLFIPNPQTVMSMVGPGGAALMFFPFAQAELKKYPTMTTTQIITGFRNLTGQQPPKEALDLFMAQRREDLNKEIASAANAQGQPGLLNNPNWVAREVVRRDFALATDQEKQLAGVPAGISKGAAEAGAEAGYAPGLAADLRPMQPVMPGQPVPTPGPGGIPGPPTVTPPQVVPPGTPGAVETPIPTAPGQTGAQYFRKKAEQEAETHAGRQAEETGKGRARADIAMDPFKMVNDAQTLSDLVNPNTWERAKPDTRGNIDAKIKSGELFVVRGGPEGLPGLDKMIERLDRATDILMPIYSQYGGFATWLKSLGIVGFTLPKVGYQILGGMLSDKAQRQYVDTLVKKGVTPEEATKIVQAMSDIIYAKNEAPLLMSMLGQRGARAVHILKEEVNSLPTMHENSVTVKQKMAALHSMRDGVWAHFGLPKRYAVVGPNGQAAYWRPDQMPELPQGWARRY